MRNWARLSACLKPSQRKDGDTAMPCTLSLDLRGDERRLKIVCGYTGETRSAYVRRVIAESIEREAQQSPALGALLETTE